MPLVSSTGPVLAHNGMFMGIHASSYSGPDMGSDSVNDATHADAYKNYTDCVSISSRFISNRVSNQVGVSN